MTSGSKGESGVPEAARQTPYELAFEEAFEGSVFPAIREEAEARGAATSSPEIFLLLGAVGNALRDFMPEAELEAAAGPVLDEFGKLFFQAYHFWRYGRRVLLLSRDAARQLVDGMPHPGDWELTPPHPAGYLQFPRHLFWVQPEPRAAAEPVDGLFWTMIGEEDPAQPPYGRMDAVVISGMRPGRPGFSTMGVSAELVGERPGHWVEADARPAGRDFASVLPGGELERLYSLTTVTEVLKLISLCFWHIAVHPDAVEAREATPAGSEPPTPHDLPPSALPYDVIRVVADG